MGLLPASIKPNSSAHDDFLPRQLDLNLPSWAWLPHDTDFNPHSVDFIYEYVKIRTSASTRCITWCRCRNSAVLGSMLTGSHWSLKKTFGVHSLGFDTAKLQALAALLSGAGLLHCSLWLVGQQHTTCECYPHYRTGRLLSLLLIDYLSKKAQHLNFWIFISATDQHFRELASWVLRYVVP